jgi:hypothetical protein
MPTTPRPRVPAPVAAASASLFGLASRIRGKRCLHPHGVGFEATFSVDRPARYADAELLGTQRTWPAVVRLSRGVGLPPSVPDVLGLAVRIEDAYGRDRHQDFLLVSSARGPVWQHLILPGPAGFGGHSYSSVLAYRIGADLRIVGAEPVGVGARERIGLAQLRAEPRPEIGFELTLATLGGRWEGVARLEFGARLDDARAEALAFNPWNTGAGIVPAGPFMGLRRPSYVGSQQGRGVEPQGEGAGDLSPERGSERIAPASGDPSRGGSTWA